HCHGRAGIEAAVDAGVDSIEHCSFLGADGRVSADDAMLERLAASGVVISATIGRLPDFPVPPLVAANLVALDGVRARLHRLGATIVAGTDAGINEGKPHDVLPFALADFVSAGVRPVDGLRAMTTVAAGVCGVGDRKGRLAAGYDADVLAVRGDPTIDAAALTAVIGVWRNGTRATG
ncbi:MAG: amidohydrolase family protein, partial [Acidimicrobiia bacterium]|nr:amidohydrolase family protein [Acidimicrobiia bacterium]